jgi:hypothetical protein
VPLQGRGFWLIRSDNPLAICNLSATLSQPLPGRISTILGLSA